MKVFVVTQGNEGSFVANATSFKMALQRVADVCCLSVSDLVVAHHKNMYGPGEDAWYVGNLYGFEIREREVLGS